MFAAFFLFTNPRCTSPHVSKGDTSKDSVLSIAPVNAHGKISFFARKTSSFARKISFFARKTSSFARKISFFACNNSSFARKSSSFARTRRFFASRIRQLPAKTHHLPSQNGFLTSRTANCPQKPVICRRKHKKGPPIARRAL